MKFIAKHFQGDYNIRKSICGFENDAVLGDNILMAVPGLFSENNACDKRDELRHSEERRVGEQTVYSKSEFLETETCGQLESVRKHWEKEIECRVYKACKLKVEC